MLTLVRLQVELELELQLALAVGSSRPKSKHIHCPKGRLCVCSRTLAMKGCASLAFRGNLLL